MSPNSQLIASYIVLPPQATELVGDAFGGLMN